MSGHPPMNRPTETASPTRNRETRKSKPIERSSREAQDEGSRAGRYEAGEERPSRGVAGSGATGCGVTECPAISNSLVAAPPRNASAAARQSRPWQAESGRSSKPPSRPPDSEGSQRRNPDEMRLRLDPEENCGAAAGLQTELRKMIAGQQEAIQEIVNVYQMHLAGLATPQRPIGALLLLGPTGTGKTRIVEALAETLGGHATRGPQDRLRGVPAQP